MLPTTTTHTYIEIAVRHAMAFDSFYVIFVFKFYYHLARRLAICIRIGFFFVFFLLDVEIAATFFALVENIPNECIKLSYMQNNMRTGDAKVEIIS